MDPVRTNTVSLAMQLSPQTYTVPRHDAVTGRATQPVAARRARVLKNGLWCAQVMAETSGNVAVAFDQIDKAPEEKARGITISTAHGRLCNRSQILRQI